MKVAVSLVLLFAASIASAQNLQVKNLTVTGATTLAIPPAVTGGCSNILSYGGSGDGATDNTKALANALEAFTNGRACVYFPPGKFSFASGISYTLPREPLIYS
jgi:polygalacturonase